MKEKKEEVDYKRMAEEEIKESLATMISTRDKISEIKDKILLLKERFEWDDNKIGKFIHKNVKTYLEVFDSQEITSTEKALSDLYWLIAMKGSKKGIKRCLQYLFDKKFKKKTIEEMLKKAFTEQKEIFRSGAMRDDLIVKITPIGDMIFKLIH